MPLVFRERMQRVLAEQDMLNLELEKNRKRLDSRSRELNKRETLTERDMQKLDEEKNKVINVYLTVVLYTMRVKLCRLFGTFHSVYLFRFL